MLSSQKNVFLFPPYLFLQDCGRSAAWNLSPAQLQPKSEKQKAEKALIANVHIIKSVRRIKFHTHSPALGGRAHLWEGDLPFWPFSAANLPCRSGTAFPGAQPFPSWQRGRFAGNGHGKFSGYLMTVPHGCVTAVPTRHR